MNLLLFTTRYAPHDGILGMHAEQNCLDIQHEQVHELWERFSTAK